MNFNLALAGLKYTGDNLKHRRFAGAVGTNQTDDLTAMDIKGNVLKRAELLKE